MLVERNNFIDMRHLFWFPCLYWKHVWRGFFVSLVLVLAVSYRGIYDGNVLAYLNKYKVKTNTEHNEIKFKINRFHTRY